MEEERPNPDLLLKQIQTEEAEAARKIGKLKIFFGYAAGVGKTYAMLEAAHAAKTEGIDVVAGYIEPHTRPETLALLNGLESLPPLLVAHRGITLREFDLDATLKRKPQLVLVDELAHTNAEGCRHRKRYQDIQEVLRAGIDVFTTVNVQHIESLNDIVASITGITVRERIPDDVFDQADQVELVDIEPDDLIERLERGKIYQQNQAQRALGHFFTRDNLVALREIALRRTADRVNRTAERERKAAAKEKLPTEEHILICLSSSPSNAKVIRTGARMAEAFHGMFTALFVETPGTRELSGENRMRLRRNLKLAEQLGARISTVYGEDVPAQIAEYAKASGISKIVIGRSNNKRTLFSWIRNPQSLVDRLTKLAPSVDIYVIPDTPVKYVPPSPRSFRKPPKFSVVDFMKTVGILGAVSLLGLWLFLLGFSEASIIAFYILGVLLISSVTNGWVYGASASVVSVLAFNYFFTDPRFTLQAYDAEYPITFVVMFIVSFLTSTLTMRVKKQAALSAFQAQRTEVLLETSQKLQRAMSRREIYEAMAGQLLRLLNRTIILYPIEIQTKGGRRLGQPMPFPLGNTDVSPYLAQDERAVAEWAFRNSKHAGATTDTLPGARCLYLAVRSHDEVFAVVGIVIPRDDELDAFEKNLLIALLGEFALALEKDHINETKNQISLQAQQEQLRANLLRAISHDLRTPLTSISGNAGILMENESVLDRKKKRQLYTDIYDDSMWLINLVENLLSVTRIENGSMNIHETPELLEEVVQEALRHINRKKAEHRITFEQEDDLLMARMDSRLVIQVIINIVDNAIKYTPPGSHIDIQTKREGEWAVVTIADDGPGIADDVKKRLFDMFFTTDHTHGEGRRGLGLGLSLCKSIINAHGGTISVQDNIPRGTVFRFTLHAEKEFHLE